MHEYTVSFLARVTWHPVQIYNYLTNHWTCEKQLTSEYCFSTGGHTAAMVPVYLYGTGAERINGVLDNTELAHMLKRQVLPDNRRSVSAMKIKSSKIIHLIHKTVRSYFCQACR